MKRNKALGLLAVTALAFAGVNGALAAGHAKTGVNIGLQLEPPHLDPTAGAAGAIDDVTYANVFEGLTRINQNGEVLPALEQVLSVRVVDVDDEGTATIEGVIDRVTLRPNDKATVPSSQYDFAFASPASCLSSKTC